MKGYQINFITEQNQRVEGKPATEWLIYLAKELGCTGTPPLRASRASDAMGDAILSRAGAILPVP